MIKRLLLAILFLGLITACSPVSVEESQIAVGEPHPNIPEEKDLPVVDEEMEEPEILEPVLESEEDDDAPMEPIELPESVDEYREIEVTMKQWEFVPENIVVQEGEKIRLVVTSADVAHGILINAYDINEKFDAGETKTIEFTADKKGSFRMSCNVFCGSGHGSMDGRLIVE